MLEPEVNDSQPTIERVDPGHERCAAKLRAYCRENASWRIRVRELRAELDRLRGVEESYVALTDALAKRVRP